MSSEAILPSAEKPIPAWRARLWFPTLMAVLYWLVILVIRGIDMPGITRFMTMGSALLVLLLSVLIWWFAIYRQLNWIERLLSIVAAIVGGVLVKLVSGANVMGVGLVLMGIPWVLTCLIVWQHLTRNAARHVRFFGTLGAVWLAWTPFLAIRMTGLKGNVDVSWEWRWSPTPEELFLAQHQKNVGAAPAKTAPIATAETIEQTGDWTGFRGPNRDSVVRGSKIESDWSSNPPKALWRQRAGPSWSSMIVIGERLVTQEQRGENEVVACMDAATGKELWVHADKVRHTDNESGAGPRGTPAYSGGRVVTLGGDGTLNCLDLATGAKHWSHDIKGVAGGNKPVWGFSSSPLILNGLTIVFAGTGGADAKKNLLAYDVKMGALVWAVPDGQMAYTSPHLAVLNGVPQVLSYTNKGLLSVDPATGKTLWNFEYENKRMWRALQPHPLGGNSVMLSDTDSATVLLDVALKDNVWTATERWRSRDLKPSYNDYAIHDGYIYGFTGGIFCCVDAKTGKQKWKAGMYDHGQMLLLADQSLILVLTERGEVVLLAANPEQHTELGTFDAIAGKTWNHMAYARGRLYVRNAVEIACYQLPEKK